MSEHTKGEWQTVFFKGMNEQEMYVKVSGGTCICKILDRPLVEKKANARLIAAAPDLLAACKRLETIKQWASTIKNAPEELSSDIEFIEAAIAKGKVKE